MPTVSSVSTCHQNTSNTNHSEPDEACPNSVRVAFNTDSLASELSPPNRFTACILKFNCNYHEHTHDSKPNERPSTPQQTDPSVFAHWNWILLPSSLPSITQPPFCILFGLCAAFKLYQRKHMRMQWSQLCAADCSPAAARTCVCVLINSSSCACK